MTAGRPSGATEMAPARHAYSTDEATVTVVAGEVALAAYRVMRSAGSRRTFGGNIPGGTRRLGGGRTVFPILSQDRTYMHALALSQRERAV